MAPLEATATKEQLDFLLDRTELHRKMADRKDNPFRWRVASFMVPRGASEGQRQAVCRKAGKTFVGQQQREGWVQASKLQFWKEKGIAHDLSRNVYLFDREEWRVRGIFRKEDFKPVKVPIGMDILREDPAETMTLEQAVKAHGLKPDDIESIIRQGRRSPALRP